MAETQTALERYLALMTAPRTPPGGGDDPAGTQLGSALLARPFAPPRWAVEGLLPEGVAVLAGRPKLGKSWLALGLSLAVAGGTQALGTRPVAAGPTLYLALEDGERRLAGRLRVALGEAPCPPTWHYRTSCPPLDQGGLALLDGWLAGQAEPRLVVIDTLKRVRPKETSASQYGQDYDTLAPLADLAAARRVCILVVHHTRKAAAEDALDAVSGTTGLTAAADAVLVLSRGRGERTATLTVMGRDLEEQELALRLGDGSPLWTLGDESRIGSQSALLSAERQAVLAVLAAGDGPLTPKAIAAALGEGDSVNIRFRLGKLVASGLVRQVSYGRYTLAPPDEQLDLPAPPAPIEQQPPASMQPWPWPPPPASVPETLDDCADVCCMCGVPVEYYTPQGQAFCDEHGPGPHAAWPDAYRG